VKERSKKKERDGQQNMEKKQPFDLIHHDFEKKVVL